MSTKRGNWGGRRVGSGRKRKSAAIHQLQGTFRRDRHGPAPKAAAPVVIPPATAGASGLVSADPPAHLSAAAADWWRYVVVSWRLDRHHLLVLRAACEAWDQAQLAREALARDGLTVPTADGSIKAHPCAAMVTAGRAQFASLVAQLDLDDAGTPGVGGQHDGYSETAG
jgi:P27 family predicted phage terminase small subunit